MEDCWPSSKANILAITFIVYFDYRTRTIPLNFLALRSFRFLIERWKKAGGSDPAQYILFHRAQRRHAEIDFSKPQGRIYKAARQILKEAGLAHLDPYNMRPHAITKLLNNPKESDQLTQEIAGHISKKMQSGYSKQRLETKRLALDAFGGGIFKAAVFSQEKEHEQKENERTDKADKVVPS